VYAASTAPASGSIQSTRRPFIFVPGLRASAATATARRRGFDMGVVAGFAAATERFARCTRCVAPLRVVAAFII